jgi:hypothetical protein
MSEALYPLSGDNTINYHPRSLQSDSIALLNISSGILAISIIYSNSN